MWNLLRYLSVFNWLRELVERRFWKRKIVGFVRGHPFDRLTEHAPASMIAMAFVVKKQQPVV